jgi:HlyD family secretion protein
MKSNPRRIILPIVLVLAIVGGVWYFVVRPAGSVAAAWESIVNPSAPASGPLTASGTVETTGIDLAPQQPGKIMEVMVQEGDEVKTGDELVHLDDSTLKIQRSIAAANLEKAQIALQQLTSPTALALAEQSVAQDQKALDNAQTALNNQLYYSTNTGAIKDALAKLTVANDALSKAQTFYDKVPGDPKKDAQKAAAYQKLYGAQQAAQKAKTNYNWWTGKPNQEEIDLRTAQLALAKAKLAEDQTLVNVLKGESIPDEATGAGIMQLREAQLAVQIAQSNLDLLDTQIQQMTIKSPVNGVIMTRNAEPGSVVNAGAALLNLGRLDELTITVYVPEDRIGEVLLGENAGVAVDSFPGEVFKATVSYVSDQAEFTPRNVETATGRKNTVFAVKLKLNDISGRLKPGMPADVTFNPK